MVRGCYHNEWVKGCTLCDLYFTREDYRRAMDALPPLPQTATPIRIMPAQQSRGPGLLRKAANFGKAVVQHAAAGWQTISDGQKRIRLTICEACPEFTQERTCNRCGCYMDVKAGWKEQKCPLNKWPDD